MRLNTAAAFKPNSIGKYVVYRHIIAKFDGLIVDYVFGAVDPVAVVQVGSGDDEHADEFACRVVYRAVVSMAQCPAVRPTRAPGSTKPRVQLCVP
ncbi:Uncharacterised protein [Mycobacteroides abscessus subsp. abscessus]|nr:Uncharacterised protein [Mycobacteroides abscessus subsp. abscessus]